MIQIKINFSVFKIRFFLLSIILTLFGVYQLVPIDFKSFILMIMFFLILLAVVNEMKWEIPIFILILLILSFWIKSLIALNNFRSERLVFPDSLKYVNEVSIMLSSNMSLNEVITTINTIQFGYHYFLYFIFIIFSNVFAYFLVNILLFSISSLVFYKLILKDFGNKIAFWTTSMLLISTNMTLFSTNILKDVLVFTLIILGLFLYRKNRIFLSLIVGIVLFTIRIYGGASLIIAILLDLIITSNFSKIRKIILSICILIMFLIINIFSVSNYFVANISSFFTNFNILTTVIDTGVALVKFYFSPLFWNVNSLDNMYVLLVFDSLVFLFFSVFLLMFIFKFLKYKNLRAHSVVYIVPILLHAVALGLEYDGSSDRQRVGIFGFLILTYIIGVLYKEKNTTKLNGRIYD